VNPVAALSSAEKATQGQSPSPKLVKAAQEFEAILLSSWLEKLQESYAGPDDGSDPAHGTLASMGTQTIAQALAARGGIGIAKLLLQHLAKPAQTAEVAESPIGEKELLRPKVMLETGR
jgi:Rod binding domain-containing protein